MDAERKLEVAGQSYQVSITEETIDEKKLTRIVVDRIHKSATRAQKLEVAKVLSIDLGRAMVK